MLGKFAKGTLEPNFLFVKLMIGKIGTEVPNFHWNTEITLSQFILSMFSADLKGM
jgi:hypothetical protein